MRSSIARSGFRFALALSAIALLQGCAELQNIRVAPLPTANSSSNRSMLSYYDPRSSHYNRGSEEGALLRAPEDRRSSFFWMH